jgi:hypothetical protein
MKEANKSVIKMLIQITVCLICNTNSHIINKRQNYTIHICNKHITSQRSCMKLTYIKIKYTNVIQQKYDLNH